jgi:hypothetical protein
MIIVAILAALLLVSLPLEVNADSGTVDLELGGEGASSWNFTNIQPGDSGTREVILHNAGSKAGLLKIWISDIVSTESENPESETGNLTEPGELTNYLQFNCSGIGLVTNIDLPAMLDELPESVSDSRYLRIDTLNANQEITLTWQWELPETTGNDVQGDSLSFTINYTLEEIDTGEDDSGDYDDYGDEEVIFDRTPPVILDIKVNPYEASGGGTQVDITWITDETSNSQVEYWAGPLHLSKVHDAMVIDHLINLTGLTPNTLYSYIVKSRDEAGNLAVSDIQTFTTPSVQEELLPPTVEPPSEPVTPGIPDDTAPPEDQPSPDVFEEADDKSEDSSQYENPDATSLPEQEPGLPLGLNIYAWIGIGAGLCIASGIIIRVLIKRSKV